MLEAILGGLSLVVIIALRIALSPRTHQAVDRAIKDHTTSNMSNNLELYEQMKAAKARGEEFQPPRGFN
ncbi:MAG: hypothetical protein ACKOQM_14810 [Novosphingobium sp.]